MKTEYLNKGGYVLCKMRFLNNYDYESWGYPKYANENDVGFDIRCASSEPIVIERFETVIIPTGFCVELPPGFQLEIRTRSGLAFKHGLIVLNSPGTVDPSYRGEVKVILFNVGKDKVTINRGDRIAQGVVMSYYTCIFEKTSSLSKTSRNEGGFGSTKIK